MHDRAQVTSLEAVETFRARLIVYREKAGRVLDEVAEDVLRTRLWLQNDRRTHWKKQIYTRQKELQIRQQELFSAKLSGMRDASFMQQQAVHKARRAVREAESRLEKVKQWSRQYEQRVEPLGRQADKLRHNLVHDLGKAITYLNEVTKTLREYSSMAPPGFRPPAAEGEEDRSSAHD
jgi:hypothetical protein